MSGGIYFVVACDRCGVEADPGIRYSRRQDAVRAKSRVVRYESWLLTKPRDINTGLLCPECAAREG